MIQTDILFCGQQCTLACDGKCNKAWGINNRPELIRNVFGDYVEMTPEERFDEAICPNADDTVDLADGELGTAPADPGTYEGDEAKPTNAIHNKWCARECERSVLVDRGQPIELPDYDKRHYNITPHTRD